MDEHNLISKTLDVKGSSDLLRATGRYSLTAGGLRFGHLDINDNFCAAIHCPWTISWPDAKHNLRTLEASLSQVAQSFDKNISIDNLADLSGLIVEAHYEPDGPDGKGIHSRFDFRMPKERASTPDENICDMSSLIFQDYCGASIKNLAHLRELLDSPRAETLKKYCFNYNSERRSDSAKITGNKRFAMEFRAQYLVWGGPKRYDNWQASITSNVGRLPTKELLEYIASTHVDRDRFADIDFSLAAKVIGEKIRKTYRPETINYVVISRNAVMSEQHVSDQQPMQPYERQRNDPVRNYKIFMDLPDAQDYIRQECPSDPLLTKVVVSKQIRNDVAEKGTYVFLKEMREYDDDQSYVWHELAEHNSFADLTQAYDGTDYRPDAFVFSGIGRQYGLKVLERV